MVFFLVFVQKATVGFNDKSRLKKNKVCSLIVIFCDGKFLKSIFFRHHRKLELIGKLYLYTSLEYLLCYIIFFCQT